MNRQRLQYLFRKYFDKTADPQEREELFCYISKASDEDITALMEKVYEEHDDSDGCSLPDKKDEILKSVFSQKKIPTKELSSSNLSIKKINYKYISIAALLLICTTVGLFMYADQFSFLQTDTELVDIEQDGRKAVLTLANGTTIDLGKVSNGGKILDEKGISVSKASDGQLVYRRSEDTDTDNAPPVYHSIKIPRGGQYMLVLPDGSKVWLNAESTLKFPAAFPKKERRVELSGEGYFEIAKNKESPFIVVTDRQKVTVLGTQFNINSYKENPVVKTTLLEGSVEISGFQENDPDNMVSKMLKPGEESVLDSGNNITIRSVDVSHSIAWKNGLFHFENTGIKEVMEEFSRWYNIDVEFEGILPNIKLWGSVYRNVSVSEALGILEYFNLKYRIVDESKSDSKKKVVISSM